MTIALGFDMTIALGVAVWVFLMFCVLAVFAINIGKWRSVGDGQMACIKR
jgi:hypothetical protein